jgi:hypothetical protein
MSLAQLGRTGEAQIEFAEFTRRSTTRRSVQREDWRAIKEQSEMRQRKFQTAEQYLCRDVAR